MWESLAGLFNWQWIVQSVAWAIVGSVAMRAWVWWRSGKGAKLSRKREITFWVLAPTTILALLALLGSLTAPHGLRPQFQGELGTYTSGTLALPNNPSYVWVSATIKNLGSPSVAERFRLRVTLANGVQKEGELNRLADTFDMRYADGRIQRVSYGDQIDVRGVQPIPTGGEVVGGLLYVFKDTSAETLHSQVVEIRLIFRDVLGNEYYASTKTAGETSEILSIPGLAPGITNPSPTPSIRRRQN